MQRQQSGPCGRPSPPLVILVLRVEPAVLRFVGRPHHVVLAPLKGKSAHLLFLGVAILGWHLLPFLVSLLEFLVGSILLVLRFLILFVITLVVFFLVVLCKGTELGVELELALEGVNLGRHRHDLFVVGRFGSPLARGLQVIEVRLGKGHEGFVGNGKCPVEKVVVLLFHVGFKVVAGHDKVGVEQNVEGTVDCGPLSQNLLVVAVELCVDFIDVPTNRRSEYRQVLQVVSQGLGGGNGVIGGKAHDHLIHHWGVLDTIEGVLFAVGE
jgi:hypothetical protein